MHEWFRHINNYDGNFIRGIYHRAINDPLSYVWAIFSNLLRIFVNIIDYPYHLTLVYLVASRIHQRFFDFAFKIKTIYIFQFHLLHQFSCLINLNFGNEHIKNVEKLRIQVVNVIYIYILSLSKTMLNIAIFNVRCIEHELTF